MDKLHKKIKREQKVISQMISLYCKYNHHSKDKLCSECQELTDYAIIRIQSCPFMQSKTFCSSCKVHCYKRQMREKIKLVMRFSGPRMIIYHPILTISHLIETIKQKRKMGRNA